jgi:hypothetical protein
MNTINATMATAAMATMATVDDAMSTRGFCPVLCVPNCDPTLQLVQDDRLLAKFARQSGDRPTDRLVLVACLGD